MATTFTIPTILATENSGRARRALLQNLQHQGYFVLQAQDEVDAIEIARVHSRPIQLMLAAESVDDRTLAARIKLYRPCMDVLFLAHGFIPENPDADLLAPEISRVQAILKPPVNSNRDR